MTTARPVHEVRLGRIVAAIWLNHTDSGAPRHNVTVSRLYKRDGDSSWSRSDAFGRDDLLVAAKVLDQAHTWILEQPHTAESAGS